MDQLGEQEFDALQRAAREITRDWPAEKAAMALRAVGLSGVDRPSLDAIAAESGVSRETVRRARNALLVELEKGVGHLGIRSIHSLGGSIRVTTDGAVATLRALRRFLTMTGPLEWDEVLTAWARAGGRAPYAPLSTDVVSMRRWIESAGGFFLTPENAVGGSTTIGVLRPEELDQVGHFLFETLRKHPGGVDRAELLSAAENAGLKPTTIATALSQHPAVVRLGRGTWALRGQVDRPVLPTPMAPARRKQDRIRPTSFKWTAEGLLAIEFSVPRTPSPVIAVPAAIAPLVEGKDFVIEDTRKRTQITVGNARLWGFGSIVSERGMIRGQRVCLTLNLISGTAKLETAGRENGH